MFTDVALQAGLTQPVIYGDVDKKSVIVETVGCGAAFLDYDNDGWLDIFVLSGTRFEGAPPGTTNRLYKNNRDGTFKDVTVEAGLVRTGWACSVTVADYNNDGYEDIFVTYYGAERSLPQQREWNLHRCDGRRRPDASGKTPMGRRVYLSGL